jgi:phage-related protein
VGIGREVADAYIDVHGDLKNFRRDLEGARGDVQKAAREQADQFADAWGKRVQQDVNGKWGDIVNAMYSEKQVDWDRLIGEFNPRSLDDARQKITEFLREMRDTDHLIDEIGEDGKKTGEQIADGTKLANDEFDRMVGRLHEVVAGMQKQEDHQRRLIELQQTLSGMQDKEFLKQQEEGRIQEAFAKAEENLAKLQEDAHRMNEEWMQRRAKTMQEAIDMNKAWARTFEGMRKNNAIKDMEADFKKLAEVMTSVDMEGFAKSFDNLHQARARIYDVTAAMQDQKRMSQDMADVLHAQINQFIDDQNAKSKAMKDALDETNRLRKAQDDYNASLSGMARNFHFQELENNFRNLARAMDTNDFSHFERGARNVREMRDRISETAFQMHNLGRMTDGELSRIMGKIGLVNGRFQQMRGEGTRAFASLRNAASRFGGFVSGVSSKLQGVREHLQGFAGLNVFGDMIRQGFDFIHNLDRIAVSASNLTMKLSAVASIGGSALQSLFVIVDDLGQSISGLSALIPAFATGFGIMAYVGMTALQGMALKYKKELKQWKEDMFNELDKGLKPAMDRFSNVMLPTLQKNLKKVAAAEGRLFGAILDGITSSTGPDKMNLMFQRMNDAMDKSHVGVKAFIDAWARLGLVGSKYFGRFADWINKLGTNFDDFIKKAEKDGHIDKWIERGIKGFKDMGRAIDGTMGIFNAIVDAARRAGSGGLDAFATALQDIAKTMQEKGFQDTMVMLFSGMRIEAEKIGDALYDLGPAIQSVMPSVKIALSDLGDAVADIIGYIGQILTNPTVQKGITDFTGGIADAIATLEPAIKPFADSIGNMLTLLGKIVVSVAKIATAFTVNLAPVLDTMSTKVQTLLDPLSDAATNVVEKFKPILEAFDKFIVAPIVAGMKGNLIPAFNGFVDKAGPVIAKMVEDLGPTIKTLATETLPKAVQFATELLAPLGSLFALFTPTLQSLVEKVGKGFDSLAAAMRIAKLEARPEDWGILFGSFSMEQAKANLDEQQRKLDSFGKTNKIKWGEVMKEILVGDLSYGLGIAAKKLVDTLAPGLGAALTQGMGSINYDDPTSQAMFKALDKNIKDQIRKTVELFTGSNPEMNDLSDKVDHWVVEAFRNLFDNILPSLQSANIDLSNGIKEFFDDQGRKIDNLDAVVNKWFEDSIFKPIRTGWENDMRRINEWWQTTIPESFKSDTKDYGLGPAIMNWITNDVLHLGDANVESINKTVNDWFENNVFKPVRDAWNTAMTSVTDWFKSGGDHESSNRGDGNGQVNFPALWNSFWSEGNIGDINQTVNDWFENTIFRPIREAWDTAWKAVSDWLTSGGGGESSNRSDTNGQAFWQSFWGGFGGMMGDVNQWAEGINATVNNWLETNVWKPIKDWVANLDWAQIGADLWNGFIQGLTGKDVNAWEKIGQGFTGWVEDMKRFFGIQSPSTLMFGIAGDIVAGFLNGFGDFAASVGAKWEEIKTTVTTKFQEVVDGLAGKWEEFKTGWSTFWTDVGTTLGTKWEEFKTTVSTKFEELKTGVTSAWEGFQTGWSQFWTDTGTTLSTKWEEFKTTVSGKAGEIKSGIEGWAGDVTNGWNGFWGDVGNTLGQKWGEFTNTTSTKAGEIRNNISNFGSDVSRNWSGFWGTVGGTLSDKWNQFTGTVRDKSGNMKGDVQGMGTSMIGNVQSAMAQMWNSLSGAFMNFVSLVMNKANDIMGYISGLPGRIAGALGGLSYLLWGAGSSIMGGFLSGLRSSWGAVTDFVGGIAAWIRANKGPLDYDAKLLVPAGEAIMGGLQRGLESKMDPLLNTLQTITALVTDSVTADLSKSVMYVAGADAAQGLADGLKANRDSVHNALGTLGAFTVPTSEVTVGGAFSAVGRPTADSTSRAFNIAEGAVQVHTQATDPWIIAGTVTDALSDAFSTNSRM